MGFFDKILKWVGKAFSFVDDAISRYQDIKGSLPGLIELIESIYFMLLPRIEDPEDSMTSGQAREELVETVATKFTNSPLSIPRSFIREALEVVHRYHNRIPHRFYDMPGTKEQANRVLKGLSNKYGNR